MQYFLWRAQRNYATITWKSVLNQMWPNMKLGGQVPLHVPVESKYIAIIKFVKKYKHIYTKSGSTTTIVFFV